MESHLIWTITRPLPGGRELVVYPLFSGRARLCIGWQGDMSYDDVW